MDYTNAKAAIVLIGCIGHGKTCLINKMCGTNYASKSTARSCTRTLQHGMTKKHSIVVIDSPGVGSSTDLGDHIGAQKAVLEQVPLSGIYVVVKFGKVEDVVNHVSSVMDFVGSDDCIRVIVTFADLLEDDEDFDKDKYVSELGDDLDIDTRNIFFAGTSTTAEELDNFVNATRHAPKKFRVDDDSVANIAAVSSGNRRFEGQIAEIHRQIERAQAFCNDLTSGQKPQNSWQKRLLCESLLKIQEAVVETTKKRRNEIYREAIENKELTKLRLVDLQDDDENDQVAHDVYAGK